MGTLKPAKTNRTQEEAELISASQLPGIPDTELVNELDAHYIKFSGSIDSGSNWMGTVLVWILPLLVVASIYAVLFKHSGSLPL